MFSVVMNTDTSKTKMIIEFGGKQHLAVPGSRIIVNQSDSKEGDTVTAKDLLSGKNINMKVIKSFKGDKIRGLKFKSKSRYTRRYGHRQHLMILEVADAKTSIPKETTTEKSKTVKKAVSTKKKIATKAKTGVK